MKTYSTNEAAKRLGITGAALSRYIKAGKVPAPNAVQTGQRIVHLWSDEDIQNLGKLLPKIANGRKTRYKKQQPAKPKKQSAQPRAAVPHEQSKSQKSKPKKKSKPRSQSAG